MLCACLIWVFAWPCWAELLRIATYNANLAGGWVVLQAIIKGEDKPLIAAAEVVAALDADARR